MIYLGLLIYVLSFFVGGDSDDLCNRSKTLGLGGAFTGHDKSGSTVRDRAGGGGSDGAVLGKGRLKRRDLVRATLAGLFVGIDKGFAAAADDGDRSDFG